MLMVRFSPIAIALNLVYDFLSEYVLNLNAPKIILNVVLECLSLSSYSNNSGSYLRDQFVK